MIAPVCVRCRCSFRKKISGVEVLEMSGVSEPSPYKLWSADLWECPGCSTEIVSGFGQHPIAEHYQDGFKERVKSVHSMSGVVIKAFERPQQ